LSKDSQIIIKKNITKEIKLELFTPYTDVINKINAYTLTNMFYTIKYKITQKLNYKLILSNEPNDYLEELGYDINYKKELSRHDLKEIKMHEYNEINALLRPFERYRKINDLLYNDNESFNPYKNIIEIYKLLHYNSEIPVFENFNTIIDNNLLTLHKNISFLNCTFSPQPTNKTIKYILKKIYSNIKTINYYDLNISSDNIMSNYITKLYNITEIDYAITKFKTKMNLIVMALVSFKLFNIDAYLYEKYYTQQFFYSIIFVLQLLKKNGTCIILSFSYFTEISIELLYILKKFFKKLVFTKYTTGKHSTSSTKIIASRFKGIPTEELNELLKIAKEISIYNKKYDNYDKNYKFIKSILDIDKTDKEYKLFRAEVIKFNTLNKKYTENNINLFSKIIQFYKTNNDNKLLDDILIRKQIHILFLWLNKYNILKICNN